MHAGPAADPSVVRWTCGEALLVHSEEAANNTTEWKRRAMYGGTLTFRNDEPRIAAFLTPRR
ncbi:hypothetical protein ACQBAU_11465 [Propionibacteriaceae bacterium Y2011]